jgi:hypothetical protein
MLPVLISSEALLTTKANSRVTQVAASHPKNKTRKPFQVFCEMDERLINCKAAPVFLYHGIWHSVYLKDGNATVGNPLPSVHNYDEDETASEEALLRGIDLQIRHSPVKNPNSSPAPHWYPYEPEVLGNAMNAYTHTLAKIAYQGNVGFGNFVQPVQPNSTVST